MSSVRVLVLSGNGTNCERETAFACKSAGADVVDVAPIWDVVAGDKRLGDYQFLCLPGGFMDGDDLGSAKACANRIHYTPIVGTRVKLWDELLAFVDSGKLVLGICNGFQLLVKLGLLPRLDGGFPKQVASLTFNDSGRFENRWVELGCDPKSPCVFTRGIESLPVPVRHGEGKFVVADKEVLSRLESAHLVPVRYIDPDTRKATQSYPANPNGSVDGVAGICDPSGRVFGLMPHPECYLTKYDHPRWRRTPEPSEEGRGLKLFHNAIEWLKAS